MLMVFTDWDGRAGEGGAGEGVEGESGQWRETGADRT